MLEAVCFDLGDTVISEESVVHNELGQAITANLVEGALEVLATIRKAGYKTALIANGDSVGARNILKRCGLQGYFDAIVISEEAGIAKPDKRIFQIALKDLETKAENAVMVGNRIDADVRGAKGMRMKSVLFKWNDRYNETINNEEDSSDFVISSLSELLGILKSM